MSSLVESVHSETLDKTLDPESPSPIPAEKSLPSKPHTEPPIPQSSLSFKDVRPANLQIRSLGVSVDMTPSWSDPASYPDLIKSRFKPQSQIKPLLQHVSASCCPGTLTAIIGGSGSGKTTLLNTVAERVTDSRLIVSGCVTVNGLEGIHAARHAYVMQQDVLLPSLTVRETLMYAAALRLPKSVSEKERADVVEQVILELGLKECANTRIGNSQHRGCSGGEKRRVSIGVQMLANPSLLFLDEPTTGLDATSAFQLVRTLKALAAKGRTIVTTIHQPRSEIWYLFDNLIILSKGSPVFSGSRESCVSWLDSQGFSLPPFVNPAEYMVDIAAIDSRSPELEEASRIRVDSLKSAWKTESDRLYNDMADTSNGKSNMDHKNPTSHPIHEHASFLTQMRVLTKRTLKVTYRDPMGMMSAMLETALMGLVSGLIFYNLSRDASGIRSRQGALYSSSAMQGYLILIFEVYRMTVDIQTFDRENGEGCVDPWAFILSRRVARFPTEDLPVPVIYSVVLYFMANFDPEISKFFIFLGISVLNHYIAMTCAMMCVALARDFPTASLTANLIYTLQTLACGMFIQIDSIPVYLRWLKYITYGWYCFGAYAGNEFEGSFYDCPYDGGESNPSCAPYTGSGIMRDLGFPRDWVARPSAVLAGFVLLFLLATYALLRFKKTTMTIARARNSEDVDLLDSKETVVIEPMPDVAAIDLTLEKFSLDLDKRSLLGKKLPRKTILRSVDATFQAGVLNVIMGPSGSGKTSLLNSVALRLQNTMTARYIPTGRLLFNGTDPSDSVVRAVCSYVCQDDDGLLPCLTVRETLRFAAGLRLPRWMSSEEKQRRAEDVLLKLGLKDCADNLVGNDLVKGISGGEKRRVSIAIQILTNPRILLLDEPTSGLDAFTASSIMEVLKGLAAEGRTLILTIHQSRSDMFGHFGNLLLLARGGMAAYSGPAAGMLEYFSSRGFDCPSHCNPADFVLDLITVDLQQAQREEESRTRVQALTEAWKQGGGVSDEKLIRARRTFTGKALATPAELGAMVRAPSPFSVAAPLLIHRAIINIRRQPQLVIARVMQAVSLAILLVLFYTPIKHNYPSIQNRMGIVQQIGSFYFSGMLQNVALYPYERDVFYREHADGVYGVTEFLLTYTAMEVPSEIASGTLAGGVLLVMVIGLPRTALLFFTTSFASFGVISCGESVGIMFNTLFNHTGFAMTLTSVVLSLANSMAGVLSTDMPAFLDAMNYLSPVRYATRIVAAYSLRGVKFTCDDTQRRPDGRCQIATGEDALELYHLNDDPVKNVIALAACVVIYRLLAWGLLKAVKRR
ncbi:hypothetical protein HOO65_050681 [Ceratocystis lukuohia]|uniref:ABC transporter domain-containing protein n=1 Tax=Ceratocystis lukuohia TaxID=2019550 RepID=A0ABR4MGZ9_9PEZI